MRRRYLKEYGDKTTFFPVGMGDANFQISFFGTLILHVLCTLYSISAPSVFADYKWDDLLFASPIDMVIICLYIGETEIRGRKDDGQFKR